MEGECADTTFQSAGLTHNQEAMFLEPL